MMTPEKSTAAVLQLVEGVDHTREGSTCKEGDAVVWPEWKSLADRIAHGALVSLPPFKGTAMGVTLDEGLTLGVVVGVIGPVVVGV